MHLHFKECLVYDGRNVYRFDEEWQQKEKCNLEEPLDKLLFASTCNQYVAWQHQESKLFVSYFLLYIYLGL